MTYVVGSDGEKAIGMADGARIDCRRSGRSRHKHDERSVVVGDEHGIGRDT